MQKYKSFFSWGDAILPNISKLTLPAFSIPLKLSKIETCHVAYR